MRYLTYDWYKIIRIKQVWCNCGCLYNLIRRMVVHGCFLTFQHHRLVIWTHCTCWVNVRTITVTVSHGITATADISFVKDWFGYVQTHFHIYTNPRKFWVWPRCPIPRKKYLYLTFFSWDRLTKTDSVITDVPEPYIYMMVQWLRWPKFG